MAMAPERIGIGIHRHFTSAGTDPFDTVRWERRDARITNYLTGAVAFEQLGVEVPSGWSVNATNILAQKYFRGTLGSPEREWSLKQVTRRVVDTITEWGRKGGYFVDDDEAEAFRDELTYLIIHQRAAFNSPVWFNIGVKGVPQQASACQPYDAMVCTDHGLRPIGELVESDAVGTKVYDAHGLTRIVAVKANGRKQVLRLHTKAGLKLDVTPDHLVWRASGVGTGTFVMAEVLQAGDLLTWHRTESLGGDADAKQLEIERIEQLGELDVYDIQTESGEYLSGNLRVHNCFILSVNDSMSSILNWYVEEGTIFKGGSGSGINLSRIRSSKEGLRGGGTASGPVSFMRGADASAGTIKCLHEDTPIVTSSGVRPIRAVDVGSLVPTRSGLRPVLARHDNGVRPLVRVAPTSGDEVLCTPEHRFWARSGDGEGWRKAGQLQPGDAVLLDVSGVDAGSPQALVSPAAGHNNEIQRDLPTVLDQSMALWLGWLFGDGSITRGPSANFISVQLGDDDAELLGRYRAIVQSLFGDVNIFVNRHNDKPDASASVRFCSTRVIRFLEDNGLLKGSADQDRIPDLIAASPAPVRAAFLAGLFEADGHIGNGYAWLSTVSNELATGTQRMLHSLGIPTWRGRIDDRRADYGDRPVHTIRVVGGEGMRRFAKLVGFVSERKSRLLEAALARGDVSTFERQWALPHAVAELDELWVGGDATLRGALAPYCRYATPRSLSLLRARVLLDRFPHQLEGTVVERFARGNEFWTPVTVEQAGEGPTFDLTVDGVHEYFVHNLVTHNSGGKTRRAAKMVILNVDHPDIEAFIWCKTTEERKARALRDAGFDMDLDGKDSHSIQYQNANNSVRVTDEFMAAVLQDGDWHLKSVTTGETLQTVKARALFRQISKASWECADPGMQFDTTINRWHTAPVTGRINGSNPCFPGDALVHTDKGMIAFKELFARVNDGEHFGVYTHDATNVDAPAPRVELTSPSAFMITGTNEIVKLRFDNGMELRCTPNHRLFTVNRGYVEARDLTAEDSVKVLDVATPAISADLALPVATDPSAYRQLGDHRRPIQLPEKWTEELAHYLGWLVGDGSATSEQTLAAVYGSTEDQEFVLPRHSELVTWINGGFTPKPSVQANGTVQQRISRRQVVGFFRALGLTATKGPSKSVPWSALQAPPAMAASFLQGLFDADGCVRRDDQKGSYVGLGSASRDLLVGVQRLLTSFGIAGTIYRGRHAGESGFAYQRKRGGASVAYQSAGSFDLRISSSSIPEFARHIGFSIPRKAEALDRLITERVRGFYQTDTTAHLVDLVEDGFETTYNLSEPRNHSYVVNGLVVRNCSEYMHLDDSACNLASLNLLTFLEEDGSFDVDGFKAATEAMFTAQEILVGNADYPTAAIGDTSRRFRQLGIGYANLGALLMAQGVPYDSDEGRAWAATITALLTGHSYATSARTAARMGPFAGYTDNRDAMLNVLRMHRDHVADIDEELVPTELLSAAQESWETAVEVGEQYGVRNSQASVLAPTGCLVGGSLIPTERGLVRLRSLGDPDGAQWQDLDIAVATDDGPRPASKFYVNGTEAVVSVATARGYRIQGTPTHRVKVVDRITGEWRWKRFGEITPGDLVPLALDQLIGEPQTVPLPPLPDAYWTGEHHTAVTRKMTPALAELVGYFMGDGSLHSRGLRLRVTAADFDVVERLLQLGKEAFGLLGHVTPKRGYTEVRFDSVRLALWWEACGFAKRLPTESHAANSGRGSTAHVPDAVLHANDASVYAAFVRGLFEADGDTSAGYPTLKNTSLDMVRDVQAVLLALGYPTTFSVRDRSAATSWGHAPLACLRLLNLSYFGAWLDQIGFMSSRKNSRVRAGTLDDGAGRQQAARLDYIPVTRAMVDRLAPTNDRLRRVLLMELKRDRVSRRVVTELHTRTGDAELGRLLSFFYDEVSRAELGDDELTYDLSVPDNVTYVANGFVSHNTIGLLMDCDTTGIEPDLGLVKTKKLVGGGTMSIVNQTVPRALRRLGYSQPQVDVIIAHIDEHKSILGAPALKAEHLPVFACSMGDNTIHYRGHVRMMGAVQPFISGAISKCVTGDTLLSTAEGLVRIGSMYRGEAPDSYRADVREVASLSGPQKTDAFYYGGVRPVTSVVLRSGHRVTGTANHRLLVSGRDGLEWRRLDEIAIGEYVATQYGDDLWSVLPARLDHLVDRENSAPPEAQRADAVASAAGEGPELGPALMPVEMSNDVAFVLGAFAAAGRVAGGGWAIHINCDVPDVLQRLADTVERAFGLTASIRRPGGGLPGARVEFRSQAVVELFDDLGCGQCAIHMRIPDAVLRSPREMVLAYLQGLSLAADVTMCGTAKWAINSESPGLLDDLQAVLTNLGIVHERATRYRKADGRSYDEVSAVGEQAHDLLTMVPFLDPHKAAFAQALRGLGRHSDRNGADVVPGISPYELYRVVPRGLRSDFSYLSDPRAMCVSRRSLEQVAAVAGSRLPQWLRTVLEDNLHFSPVESVGSAGEREVFDLSVPTTQAFVGNGIVNHNTVNMPEEATVEEVEQLHIEAWQLGLKAVAIYRDNCKVGQPLSTTKKVLADPATSEAEAHDAELALKVAELEKALQRQTVVVKQPVRERLPRRRRSMTFKFRVADCEGYVTVGEYDDGRPGEVFMQVSKQGSTLAGIMDAFAVAVSLGLQHGVPLATYVKKYTNMRFEPAGMTDDRELRIASSLVDYIFRRLAVDYLTFDERAELGILTTDERLQPTLPGVEEVTTPSSSIVEEMTEDRAAAGGASRVSVPGPRPLDAPYCYQCGVQMQRAGSCFACPSCGSTSGCS